MGKKARKLRSPKYARKASALRETFARINNKTTETTTETTTPVVEENVEEVVEAVVQITEPEPVVETPAPVIKKPNALKAPTKTTITKKPATKKTTTTTRKRRTTKAKAET
tara:strand:- start:243 stop:575 length:333 start_codon:yes stop_codon:yes gene_type:complete